MMYSYMNTVVVSSKLANCKIFGTFPKCVIKAMVMWIGPAGPEHEFVYLTVYQSSQVSLKTIKKLRYATYLL